jgi:DNA mismatch repair ATPase MutS
VLPLVDRGHKVVRVDQMETPEMEKERTGKVSKTVRRDITTLITKGTVTNMSMSTGKQHMYI